MCEQWPVRRLPEFYLVKQSQSESLLKLVSVRHFLFHEKIEHARQWERTKVQM